MDAPAHPVEPRMEFSFTRWETDRDYPLEGFGEKGAELYLGGAVFDPLGPTLSVLAADGLDGDPEEYPLVHLVLNPFRCRVRQVGTMKSGLFLPEAEMVRPFLSLPFGSTPTLLFSGSRIGFAGRTALQAEFLATFPDGHAVLEQVRRFPGDPWGRARDGLRRRAAGSRFGPPDEERPLTAGEAEELAAILLREDVLRNEFWAFSAAWRDSVRALGPDGATRAVLPGKALEKILIPLMQSCDLPFELRIPNA